MGWIIMKNVPNILKSYPLILLIFLSPIRFGNSHEDDMSLLAPIHQCCLIRYSTLSTLLSYYQGPQHLSDAMRRAMETDPVAPVLKERHLKALDRRLKKILIIVHRCLEINGVESVVIVDGF